MFFVHKSKQSIITAFDQKQNISCIIKRRSVWTHPFLLPETYLLQHLFWRSHIRGSRDAAFMTLPLPEFVGTACHIRAISPRCDTSEILHSLPCRVADLRAADTHSVIIPLCQSHLHFKVPIEQIQRDNTAISRAFLKTDKQDEDSQLTLAFLLMLSTEYHEARLWDIPTATPVIKPAADNLYVNYKRIQPLLNG